MADGFARAGGRPAACFVISGPGLTNIATAMGQAYADSIPMLVISVSKPRRARPRRGPTARASRPAAPSPPGSPPSATRSCDRPTCPPRSPAPWPSSGPRGRGRHIELPLDVIADAGDRPCGDARSRRPARRRSCGDRPGRRRRSASARTPLLILGGGAARAPARPRATLAEALGAPTLLTINGKGLLPPRPPAAASAASAAPAGARRVLARRRRGAGRSAPSSARPTRFSSRGPPGVGGRLIRIDIEGGPARAQRTPPGSVIVDRRRRRLQGAGLGARAGPRHQARAPRRRGASGARGGSPPVPAAYRQIVRAHARAGGGRPSGKRSSSGIPRSAY